MQNSIQNHTDVDLAELQEIYASADGFLNTDGADLSVLVEGYPFTVTGIEDVETYGFPNPLIAGFRNRLISTQKVKGAFLIETTVVDENTISGRRDILFSGAIKPQRKVPTTGEMLLDIKDWRLIPTDTTGEYRFRFNGPAAYPIGPSNFAGRRAEVRAMLKWLESIRESGDAVNLTPTSFGSIYTATQDRVFSLEQTSSSFVKFEISSAQWNTIGNTADLHVELTASSAAMKEQDFYNAMQEAGARTNYCKYGRGI